MWRACHVRLSVRRFVGLSDLAYLWTGGLQVLKVGQHAKSEMLAT